MISEVSQSVLGTMTPQTTRGADNVGQVQGTQPVESPASAPASNVSEPGIALPAPASDRSLQGMVADLNAFAQTVQRQLQFSVDDESGKTVIKVIDAETDEVIRQIPPQDILEMQKHLGEMNGLLFHSEA